MKKYIWIILAISLVSCSDDCMENQGGVLRQEIEVASFNKIIVGTGIQLYIKDNPEQILEVETGENRFDNVHVNVIDGVLEVVADNLCMLSPNFEPVKLYISSPNIEQIRNASEYTITSEGVLHYPILKLLVEDDESNYLNVGDFNLKIDSQSVTVVSNGIAIITLTGNTDYLGVLYYNGIGRFEGENLIAQNVQVFHRAENTIKVNPRISLKGDLYSIGDLISFFHPGIVEITEHYEGHLIFN